MQAEHTRHDIAKLYHCGMGQALRRIAREAGIPWREQGNMACFFRKSERSLPCRRRWHQSPGIFRRKHPRAPLPTRGCARGHPRQRVACKGHLRASARDRAHQRQLPVRLRHAHPLQVSRLRARGGVLQARAGARSAQRRHHLQLRRRPARRVQARLRGCEAAFRHGARHRPEPRPHALLPRPHGTGGVSRPCRGGAALPARALHRPAAHRHHVALRHVPRQGADGLLRLGARLRPGAPAGPRARQHHLQPGPRAPDLVQRLRWGGGALRRCDTAGPRTLAFVRIQGPAAPHRSPQLRPRRAVLPACAGAEPAGPGGAEQLRAHAARRAAQRVRGGGAVPAGAAGRPGPRAVPRPPRLPPRRPRRLRRRRAHVPADALRVAGQLRGGGGLQQPPRHGPQGF
mmetsp:Transcript_2864/g.6195  ORF Transcript_2864/g.6195 Transcript_2864/m.6195 type:complete len:401 (-) Transcript_2864:403-1605(-)